ncbi:hypothetical protein PG993_006781 [Apiospora rasikravindrae]|uniref:Uncharacterized protein n=1 Tax=Apiospora rasikravindrae TaxID=990691 RepID=A0ABR1T964_9PEZI
MLAPLVSTLAVVALGASGVNAGSRAWESNIKHARAVHHEAIQARDLAFEVYGNGSDVIKARSASGLDSMPNAEYHYHNASSQSIHKRWFGIKENNVELRLWPQGNIKVCFEQQTYNGKTAEQILRGPLDEARGLWRDRGLDDNKGWFKWDVVDDGAWCSDRNNRGSFLLVKYAGVGVQNMATTPGMGPQLSPGNMGNTFDKLGPRMVLSDELVMGHRNIVANFAHEMGHSWGFHHEHQNPDWWAEGWSGEARETFFFGEGSFFCERLSDHAAAEARIEASTVLTVTDKAIEKRRLCTSRKIASDWEFAGVSTTCRC